MQKSKTLFGSKEDIEKQIEENSPDGYSPKGEMNEILFEVKDNSPAPKFAYFAQEIVKEE